MGAATPLDPGRPIEIRELDSATVRNVIAYLKACTRPEHFVYRESELDALWSLADMAVRGGVAQPDGRYLLELLWRAHDSVGGGQKVEAVQALDEALAIL